MALLNWCYFDTGSCSTFGELYVGSPMADGRIPIVWNRHNGIEGGYFKILPDTTLPQTGYVLSFKNGVTIANPDVLYSGMTDFGPGHPVDPEPDLTELFQYLDELDGDPIVVGYYTPTALVPGDFDVTIMPFGGPTLNWDESISMSHNGPVGTKIYYTLDGSEPTESSTEYTAPITIGGENLPTSRLVLLKAKGIFDDGAAHQESLIEEALYVFSRPVAILAAPDGGFYSSPQQITIQANYSEAIPDIYYTTDGSVPIDVGGSPSAGAVLYNTPIALEDDLVLTAVAVANDPIDGLVYSEVEQVEYDYIEATLALEIDPPVTETVFGQPTLISLTANHPEASITYTTDGGSPLCPAAMLYDTPITLGNIPGEIRFRAIARTNEMVSNPIDVTYTFYDENADTDLDGMTDGEEGGPFEDADDDGVANMLDADSDDDGMPDYIEGDVDEDLDGIPAYLDADETKDFHYEVIWPDNGDLVMAERYALTVKVWGHDATVHIVAHAVLNFQQEDFEVASGDEETVLFMPAELIEHACNPEYPNNPVTVAMSITYEDGSGDEQMIVLTREWNLVQETNDKPLIGNVITWEKSSGAEGYNIYRKNPSETDFTKIIEVVHDSFNKTANQSALDREGELLSYYRVTAIVDGVESLFSDAMHAPDYEFPVCLVQGYITNISAQPLEGVRVNARIRRAPTIIDDSGLSSFDIAVYTDSNGEFLLKLPKGSKVLIKIDEIGLKKEYLIPYEDMADFKRLETLNN